MNAVFVHSHRFKILGDKIFSDGKLPYNTWKRYLKHFDQLTVLARGAVMNESATEVLDLSSGPNVSFDWLPALNHPVRYLAELDATRSILSEHIKKADAVIVRLSGHSWIAASIADELNRPWAVEVVGDPWDSHWNYGNLLGKLSAPFAWLQARHWIHSYAILILTLFVILAAISVLFQ